MKGDFSRSTFNRKKHYHDVRMQQGRVMLDADWNEQQDITATRVETGTLDLIGRCGGPANGKGFEIQVQGGGRIAIGKGHYYVDGILCENDAGVGPNPNFIWLSEQPDLQPNPYVLKPDTTPFVRAGTPSPGFYLAFLDVWQRHITALEDPEIREKALGGPDTATRNRTVWQVKLLSLKEDKDHTCCSDSKTWSELVRYTDAKMAAKVDKEAGPVQPCSLVTGGGYQRTENQLYRVEIHDGGAPGKATFKWSRDNGSVVAGWEDQDGKTLTVTTTGRDKVLNFAPGQWVELIDDDRELKGIPGQMVQLTAPVDDSQHIVTVSGTVNINDFSEVRKIRRWDMPDGPVTIPVNTKFIELEDGIYVKFNGSKFRTGDYWLIPARTADADIEWPVDDTVAKTPLFIPPNGIKHHFAKLAVLKLENVESTTKIGKWTLVEDCRTLFPPLSKMTGLYYVSGDGQEAHAEQALAEPLRVRVSNGAIAVPDAVVQFTIKGGGSAIAYDGGVKDPSPRTNAFPVKTDDSGIAMIKWTLGGKGPQEVEAVLPDCAGNPVPGQEVIFNATIDTAGAGQGCAIPVGSDQKFPEVIIREAKKLMEQEKRIDINICLLHGDHDPGESLAALTAFLGELSRKKVIINLKITGCGPGTRVHINTTSLVLDSISSLIIRDIEFVIQNPHLERSAILLAKIGQQEISSCRFIGTVNRLACLEVHSYGRLQLEDNYFRISKHYISGNLTNSMTALDNALNKQKKPERAKPSFANLYTNDIPESEFGKRSKAILDYVQSMSKKQMDKAIPEFTKHEGLRLMNAESTNAALRLMDAMRDPVKMERKAASEILHRLRTAATDYRPGNAIAIMDASGEAIINNNFINGILCLYGIEPIGGFPRPEEAVSFVKAFQGKYRELMSFREATNTLYLQGNSITAVYSGIMAEIVKNPELLHGITGVFLRGVILGNQVEGPDNVFFARNLYFTSNSFGQHCSPIGAAIGETIIFTGNHAIQPRAVFYNFCNGEKVGVANPGINFNP